MIDIYLIIDLLMVSFAAMLYSFRASKELLLLCIFFATTTIISLVVFNLSITLKLDLSDIWLYLFIGLSVTFGFLSKCHPVVLGYIAYLVLVGMNEVSSLQYYTISVYGTYLIQLWVAFHAKDGNLIDSRDNSTNNSHAGNTRT